MKQYASQWGFVGVVQSLCHQARYGSSQVDQTLETLESLCGRRMQNIVIRNGCVLGLHVSGELVQA